ncbi:MAG: alcohol dehydrogenase [Comamonadaceae bacterium]|nr:MAG: alcohol dehydrogenase [Comamonadaceae bacterium]
MKAAFITGHGGNEVVEVRTCEPAVRQPGEVLIRVEAATLNQVDLYMRNSGAGITHRLPQIMGLDAAGVIEEVDASETMLKLGQSVAVHPGITCGRCEFCQRGEGVLCTKMQLLGEHRDGTFAQWISVPAQNVFPMPQGLSFAQAAAMGVNYLTAWRMLFTKAQIKPWETALIFGIGGGVSLAAMQIAKAIGVKVIVTSREDSKLQRALAMGAEYGINSQTQDVAKAVLSYTGGRGVDVVIENVGEAVWPMAMKSLVRGGRLVTCGATTGDQPPADLRRIFIRQLQILGSTHGDFSEFRALLSFVEKSEIAPVIDSEFPLDRIHDALTRLESGQQFGKIALNLAG